MCKQHVGTVLEIDTDGNSEEETDKQECLVQERYQTTALDFIMQGKRVERLKNEE